MTIKKKAAKAVSPKRKPTQKPLVVVKPHIKQTTQYADLLVELDHLRSITRDVCRSIAANIERDIVEVVDMVTESGRHNDEPKVKMADLEDIVETINGLSLKPEKGRRGDLKKIEKTIQAMRKTFSKKKN